jgi:hypothetical protein
MKLLLLILFLLPNILVSQIKIDKAGDGWDLKIDSAIQLIKKTDLPKYQLLDSVCNSISFWISEFSSCELTEDSIGKIYISVKDVKLNSINNLASVLVHESFHLYFRKKGTILTSNQEEFFCYYYELGLINKLSNVEDWLIQHTKQQIINYSK